MNISVDPIQSDPGLGQKDLDPIPIQEFWIANRIDDFGSRSSTTLMRQLVIFRRFAILEVETRCAQWQGLSISRRIKIKKIKIKHTLGEIAEFDI